MLIKSNINAQSAYIYDAGIDIASPIDFTIEPHSTLSMNSRVRVDIPKGFVGFLFPRSSAARKGLNTILVPIDAGYTGELTVFLVNESDERIEISNGTRIVQLVIFPVLLARLTTAEYKERGDNRYGSSGNAL